MQKDSAMWTKSIIDVNLKLNDLLRQGQFISDKNILKISQFLLSMISEVKTKFCLKSTKKKMTMYFFLWSLMKRSWCWTRRLCLTTKKCCSMLITQLKTKCCLKSTKKRMTMYSFYWKYSLFGSLSFGMYNEVVEILNTFDIHRFFITTKNLSELLYVDFRINR